MAVKLRYFAVGLAEDEFLLVAGGDIGRAAFAVFLNASRRVEDLAVEARDAIRSSFRHGELDVAHPKIDGTEPFLVRLVEAELVAPRTRRLDKGVVLLAVEFGVGELLL